MTFASERVIGGKRGSDLMALTSLKLTSNQRLGTALEGEIVDSTRLSPVRNIQCASYYSDMGSTSGLKAFLSS